MLISFLYKFTRNCFGFCFVCRSSTNTDDLLFNRKNFPSFLLGLRNVNRIFYWSSFKKIFRIRPFIRLSTPHISSPFFIVILVRSLLYIILLVSFSHFITIVYKISIYPFLPKSLISFIFEIFSIPLKFILTLVLGF